jgi:hypothetical protein
MQCRRMNPAAGTTKHAYCDGVNAQSTVEPEAGIISARPDLTQCG